MVGRAGGGAEGFHFLEAEFLEAFGIEEGLGFLIEEGFVGRAAAFGDEEEFVGVSFGGVEVDLGGEVGLGVDLLVHGEWCGLGVAEVFLGVGAVDAFGEEFGIVAAGPDVLAFFSDDGGGAGVLAEGEDAVGGDLGVFEEHECDHAVVVGGFGVVEDGGDLGEVAGAEGEVDGLDGFGGEEFEGFGGDFEDGFAFEFGDRDVFGGEAFVFGGVRSEGEGILIEEGFFSHGDTGFLRLGGAGCKWIPVGVWGGGNHWACHRGEGW